MAFAGSGYDPVAMETTTCLTLLLQRHEDSSINRPDNHYHRLVRCGRGGKKTIFTVKLTLKLHLVTALVSLFVFWN